MLTLESFNNKVLISYLKDDDKLKAVIDRTGEEPVAKIVTVNGRRRGVVVAIGANILGWSLCSSKRTWVIGVGYVVDTFDPEKGLGIALARADFASTLHQAERELYYEKVPFSLKELLMDMKVRSEKYFVPEEDETPAE